MNYRGMQKRLRSNHDGCRGAPQAGETAVLLAAGYLAYILAARAFVELVLSEEPYMHRVALP